VLALTLTTTQFLLQVAQAAAEETETRRALTEITRDVNDGANLNYQLANATTEEREKVAVHCSPVCHAPLALFESAPRAFPPPVCAQRHQSQYP
jgi:hypothetical protein